MTWKLNSQGVKRRDHPNQTSVQRFYTARGQLKDVGWGAGSTSYVYHPDGKVNSQFRTNHVTTSYGYNGRGMIASLRHTKDGHDLAYREYWRDNRDRIEAWKRGTDNSQNGMEDGRGDRYHYDPEGQLDRASYRVANPEPGGTPGPALRADSFTYDELGNRVRSNYLANRGAMDFKRRNNKLNQYESWENGYQPPQHWGSGTFYDDSIPAPPPPPPPATPAPHPWVSPGNGVLMQDGWITGGFNALNQPVGIWSFVYWTPPGITPNWMFFGYDPLGRCVKRWVAPHVNNQVPPADSNPATYFYYDGWNLIQEVNTANNAARLYVHGGRVDEIVASQGSGQWAHHHYDARGHCILLTDPSGNIIEQYDYDAFGWSYFYTATGAPALVNGKPGSPWGNRFLFTGREWIKDLKLYDYRARMYQPELGRFLQPDPIQFKAGDYNLYRYCHNDPINKTDPMGLSPLKYIAKIVQIIRGVKDSEKTIKNVSSMKEATKALKAGEDVRFKSEKLAREGARAAGDGKTPIKEADKFGKHYHGADRKGGHALYGIANALTIKGSLPPESGSFEHGGAEVLDFFNPLSVLQDALGIRDSFRGNTTPVNATVKEEIDYAP